jgi:RNA polymerase sigma factor (sigma-70 family)
VLAAQGRDRVAGELLFARYDQMLCRVAARATRSPTEAEEAVAAARAQAWAQLPTLRDPERFGAWLAAIVRNCVVNEQRLHAKEIPVFDVPEIPVEDAELGEDEIRALRSRRAQTAVMALSERDRAAVEMAVVKKLPVSAVAAEFDISENSAYQLLHRARKRLRRAYLTPTLPDHASAACRQCATRFPDYVSGKLEDTVFVDRHIADCEDCRARLSEVLEDSLVMKGAFGLVPPVAGLALWVRRSWRRGRRQLQRGASQFTQRAATYTLVCASTLAVCGAGFLAAEQISSSPAVRSATPAARALPAAPRPTAHHATVRASKRSAPASVQHRGAEPSPKSSTDRSLFVGSPPAAPAPIRSTAPARRPSNVLTGADRAVSPPRAVIIIPAPTLPTSTTTTPVSTTPVSTTPTTTTSTSGTSTTPSGECVGQGPRSGCPINH